MGGELRVESVEGAGSSFYFTVSFGLSQPRAEPQPPVREPELHSLRMLVAGRRHRFPREARRDAARPPHSRSISRPASPRRSQSLAAALRPAVPPSTWC